MKDLELINEEISELIKTYAKLGLKTTDSAVHVTYNSVITDLNNIKELIKEISKKEH